jgi:hypothetical protein
MQPRNTRLPRRWTEASVRAELERLLADDEEWPTYSEFVRRGAKGVRDAVTHLGGDRRWAAELGVRYVPRSPGYAPRWTDARVREELAEFLGGRSTWSLRKEFEAAGRKPLRDAIGRRGGVDRWAAEFKLPGPDRHRGNIRAWDDEEQIERRLRPPIERLGRWPTRPEARRESVWSLIAALYHYGIVREWQDRLGARPKDRNPPRDPRVWTDDAIEARLAEFCAERGGWPPARTFRDAGLWGLYSAASRHGGIPGWRRRLGYAADASGLPDRVGGERRFSSSRP